MSGKTKKQDGAPKNGLANSESNAQAGAKKLADRLSSIMTQFQTQFQEICKDTDGLASYEKLLDDQKASAAELDKRNNEIAELKSQLQAAEKRVEDAEAGYKEELAKKENFINELENRQETRHAAYLRKEDMWTSESTKLAALESELQQVKIQKRAAEEQNKKLLKERDQQAKDFASYSKQIETLEANLNHKTAKLQMAMLDLSGSRKKHEELKEKVGLRDISQIKPALAFEKIADDIHALVWKHFDKQLPAPITIISISDVSVSPFQLPSNTAAARAVRCACAEAAIARILASRVFHDLGALEKKSRGELNGLIQGLSWLANHSALEAKLIQCQLAKVCDRVQRAGDVAASAARDAVRELSDWLPVTDDGAARRDFENELTKCFEQGAKLWRELLRTGESVWTKNTASMDDRYRDDIWTEYGAVEEITENGEIRRPPALPTILFPQIIAADEVLFHGRVLLLEQVVIAAAAEEWKGTAPASMRGVGTRRSSGGAGPSSPTTEKRGDGSGRRMSASSYRSGMEGGTGSDLSVTRGRDRSALRRVGHSLSSPGSSVFGSRVNEERG